MATSLYKAQSALKTCDEHEHQELSYFCRTCKKFICTSCVKTTHNGHDWDLISHVAKGRRMETPLLCRRIAKESLPKYRQNLQGIDDSISTVEKGRNEDVCKLEKRRTDIINIVNRVIDDKKRTREELAQTEISEMKDERQKISDKVEYLEKVSTSLDVNIGEYSDHDVIETEQEMLLTKEELESYVVKRNAASVELFFEELNQELVLKMTGQIKQVPILQPKDNDVTLHIIKTAEHSKNQILSVIPISETDAWIYSDKNAIKVMSIQSKGSRTIPSLAYFTMLENGDLIVTDSENKVIRRINSDGKETVIAHTKPLQPRWVCKTHTEDILVNLKDDGDSFKIKPSSRRMVQRITLTGNVLQTYEYKDDKQTKLFVSPGRSVENGNSDICIINAKSAYSGELVVLRADGRVRFIYHGMDNAREFFPSGVACDSKTRIITTDSYNKCLHLLNPTGEFLGYILCNMTEYPTAIALHKATMWIGLQCGKVKMYKYIE